MPEKPIKAIAINPVIIKVIPGPCRPLGIGAFSSFFLIPAKATIAKVQPRPEPILNAIDWIKVYSRIIMNKDTPRIAQFTVIKGKNIPKA